MTELLDVLDDEGIDRETSAFLVEALCNAEEDEWHDIVEAWASPEKVIEVLRTVPGVLQRASAHFAAVERERAAAAEAALSCQNAASLRAKLFLDALDTGVLQQIECRCLARVSRLCRSARAAAATNRVWEPRALRTCELWRIDSAPLVASCGADGSLWRRAFFQLPRPRLDGVYVAECGYDHYIRFGSSLDMRQNGREFAAGKQYEWFDYRRYLRLFPPDQDGILRCLVLQDTCAAATAIEMLLQVDPGTHRNTGRQENVQNHVVAREQLSAINNLKAARARLQTRIFSGTYEFRQDGPRVVVSYHTADGDWRIDLLLRQGQLRTFSSQLEWEQYTMTQADTGELQDFNLGRKYYPDGSKADGAPPADPQKDHFASLSFRPAGELAHLL